MSLWRSGSGTFNENAGGSAEGAGPDELSLPKAGFLCASRRLGRSKFIRFGDSRHGETLANKLLIDALIVDITFREQAAVNVRGADCRAGYRTLIEQLLQVVYRRRPTLPWLAIQPAGLLPHNGINAKQHDALLVNLDDGRVDGLSMPGNLAGHGRTAISDDRQHQKYPL